METVIKCRVATDDDIDAINRFYNSVYKNNRDKNKFEWEFNSSPAGKSIYVVAETENKIIGTQCAIPYFLITSENKIFLTGKSEDTLVSPDYRGKNVFEMMYSLLIEECKRHNFLFIWGFTYADKPFKKMKFEIPFHSKIGIFVNNPLRSSTYLLSLSDRNKLKDKLKIVGLAFFSWFKSFTLNRIDKFTTGIDSDEQALNDSHFNYLNYENSFGIKLDKDFLDYRIKNNPYSKNYKTLNYRKDGHLIISSVYNITKEGVGYIIHLYLSVKATQKEISTFFNTVLNKELKHCHTIRFWGFSNNEQNTSEISLLKKCGFTFINRGISFVWLNLDGENSLQADQFVLSRMASQGTD